jgi:phosphoketolase
MIPRIVGTLAFNDINQEVMMANALSNKERALMDAYWRAANYLSVGQIYLYDNPLLKQPLTKGHIKPRLLGHWGISRRWRRLYRPLIPASSIMGVYARFAGG